MQLQRYKLTLEYLGASYCGWQRQKDGISIQQLIEEAIYIFSKEHAQVIAAGRTDAGVNAYGQVAHVDLHKNYEPKRLMHSINHFLRPHPVGVIAAETVGQDFHARFSATNRRYVYKILNRRAVNIINNGLVYWVKQPLDVAAMQEAAKHLIGNHDFSSFRASECQAKSPVKTLDEIKIITQGEQIEIYVSALSFLHHMVRNIVGNLLMVGKGYWPPERLIDILAMRDRSKAGPTAPAMGLYFLQVEY